MNSIIQRVFSRARRSRRSVMSSELMSSDIENYYLRIVFDSLKRMLVPKDAVEVDIKRSGIAQDGLTEYGAYVRLLRWDPVLSPVLLQNIPVIDARIRRVAQASVLLEDTHFSGVWFQATCATPGAPQTLTGMPVELIVNPVTRPSA